MGVFSGTITLGFIILSAISVTCNNVCTGKNNGVQIPNIRDCRSYFVCSYGRAELFECRDGLQYDYQLGVCNWPENVTCATVEIGLEPPTVANNVPVVTLPSVVITTKPPVFEQSTSTTTQRPQYTHTITTTTKRPPMTQRPSTVRPSTIQPIYTHNPTLPGHLDDHTHPGFPENPTTSRPAYTNLPNHIPTHPGVPEHQFPSSGSGPSITTIRPPPTPQPIYTHPPPIYHPGLPQYQGIDGVPEYTYKPIQTVPPYYVEIQGNPEFINHLVPTSVPELIISTTRKEMPFPPTAAPTAAPTVVQTTMTSKTMAPMTNVPTTTIPATTKVPITTTLITTSTTSTITEIPATTSIPLIEYYPGLLASSVNPEEFACSQDGLYFAPHPRNCQAYFICESHKLHRHQCGPGIHWDYIFSQCIFADTAFCFSSDALPTQTTIGVTGPIAIGTISPPTQPPNMPEIVADPIVDCPGNQAFFAHKTDCRRYYICIGGIPIATACPEKMAWDNEQMQCSEDAEARCLATKS